MGAPSTEQSTLPSYPELPTRTWEGCPKYNWRKMDKYEKLGVNIMDAVGSKEAVIGGAFGIVIFAIAVFFLRKQIGTILIDGLKAKDNK